MSMKEADVKHVPMVGKQVRKAVESLIPVSEPFVSLREARERVVSIGWQGWPYLVSDLAKERNKDVER